MKFLEKYDFNSEDIEEFINITPKKMMDKIKDNQELIEANLSFLKGLGIKTFKEKFNKYVKESLIERLNENYKVVEYL